ncbi:PREDICTED: BTB/POZ domain-containing protein At5g47800-like [Ipomoea nil]|uniref:BTB/POZ domain-containing protein At5g47800-like n=1 Tax=Ipomoea nil TaxID=35883 RepID=UPI000900DE1F|nr:PREDICTED: BTB/POZ domain-containing protein At5g47800-like [Ipomoea nil]XP_019179354.1 PREDICTED: BTB/POZ domain-containing protein At5g47800-like [Ipomoea nil]XP_019179355.1 PREDICTED: BTB/POZ domain-containing protein At5g47800-like [Ipomoea nil]
MKFMKIGSRPDTFYTEDATRTMVSDMPSDLTILINNISFLLHKFPLLPKCGLLQRLCSNAEDSGNVVVELHDIPGGEVAFELCAKFCYGITISVSAQNFVPAFCAAKFLRMTDVFEKGNLVPKLEAFFASCILEGWKDSILALKMTEKLAEWAENLGIMRKCIDSIVEKILCPPVKVRWSYTYTRPGYDQRRRQQSAPKDWWTEDLSELSIDHFRCIISAVKSTNALQPQLIGEALHVYACRWLPDVTKALPLASSSSSAQSLDRKQRVLETIVSLIPTDAGSVSVGFLLRLLSTANHLGASPVTKAELIRRSGLQFEEATLNDLLLHSQGSGSGSGCDFGLVEIVAESFSRQWRRQASGDETRSVRSITKIAKLIDSYLQVIARDPKMPVEKMVSIASAVPEMARPVHDDLYKAINTYLKEHPDLSKAEKKHLCSILDCQKLSREVCGHAVRNDRLPLRTIVQVLFFKQDRGSTATASKLPSPKQQPHNHHHSLMKRLNLDSDQQSVKTDDRRKSSDHHVNVKGISPQIEPRKEREILEEGVSGTKLDPPRIQRTR